MASDGSKYSRNEALFGRDGQEKIARSRVAIVGLGGLGSHVAQQLSYLGIGELLLIDDDVVTWSSLNRLIGAVPSDAKEKQPKATAVRRMCTQILPGANVRTFVSRLQNEEAKCAMSQCTSIFGCLDDDGARLDLIEFCCKQKVPFFDLASDTGEIASEKWYGGRVLFSGHGERCLVCMDLLAQSELARSSMSEAELEVDKRIYGVQEDDLGGTGPSVVSINGVVASLGVTEWMVWTTGLRDPVPLLEYRGATGTVFVNRDNPRANCYYCLMWQATA